MVYLIYANVQIFQRHKVQVAGAFPLTSLKRFCVMEKNINGYFTPQNKNPCFVFLVLFLGSCLVSHLKISHPKKSFCSWKHLEPPLLNMRIHGSIIKVIFNGRIQKDDSKSRKQYILTSNRIHYQRKKNGRAFLKPNSKNFILCKKISPLLETRSVAYF